MYLNMAKDLAKNEYPEIKFDDWYIDIMAAKLIDPARQSEFKVFVAPNLYGDIISDLCAQMTGGLGFGSSGNIGEKYAVFEPTHGSAPKYAGMYKVNPIATILAVKMMLDWLGEKESARLLERAIADIIEQGKIKTYDMGGKATTLEMAEAIAGRL